MLSILMIYLHSQYVKLNENDKETETYQSGDCEKMSKWIVFCLNGVVVENVICYDFVTRHNEN